MNKTKIIAMYLPQYHEIPENSLFWGDGYTDWVAVRNAKPLYEGHDQPRVPLDENYYDLSYVSSIKWQFELAKKYGIDGFGIYHYWFNSDKNLLSTPAEIILNNADIDIKFFFSWDNASWRRTWSNVKVGNDWAPMYEQHSKNQINGVLAELDYGNKKDWKIHFDYLLPFFRDKRYIKIDNKPVFCVLNQDNETEKLLEMSACMNQFAIDSGFEGIFFIGKKKNNNIQIYENSFTYEPEWSGWTWKNCYERFLLKIHSIACKKTKRVMLFDYDQIWKKILTHANRCADKGQYYSCFVSYDDSPRRGRQGKIVIGSTPDKFEQYLSRLLSICKKQNKEFVFIIAWNEWGEGAYLEPDLTNNNAYLKALKKARNVLN